MQLLDRLGSTLSLYIENSEQSSERIFSGLVSARVQSLQTLENTRMMLQLAMSWDCFALTSCFCSCHRDCQGHVLEKRYFF